MKVKDPNSKQMVDVSHKDCPLQDCFWARPDPGIFVQGRGYRSRGGKIEWICGHRAIHGCPQDVIKKREEK